MINKMKECEWLSQASTIEKLRRKMKMTDMLTIYHIDKRANYTHNTYCALVPTSQIEQSLSNGCWDVRVGDGLPGTTKHGLDDDAKVTYHRFGNLDGVEPLVFVRGSHGTQKGNIELAEEFRHFHRLFSESNPDEYIKIDDTGTKTVVATVESDKVRIRLKELRQFISIKEMHLAVLFDHRAYSPVPLNDLGIQPGFQTHQETLFTWTLSHGDFGSGSPERAFSRLLGKRLFPPVAKENSGFGYFVKEKPKQYVDFIVNTDDEGNDILHSSNPDKLANNFGANQGAPNYQTPIHFQTQVLDKYYQKPSEYSVESGLLRCGDLWILQMDNHQNDCVVVWLGDLGRDLPYKEQLYWRSYNIQPAGGVSHIYWQRQMMCIPTDSDRADHKFLRQYYKLQDLCGKVADRQIILPLQCDDSHYLKCIRIPSTTEQKDFDELILALSKILIDSLNVKLLTKCIPQSERGDASKSIATLENLLSLLGIDSDKSYINFLKNLQNLRSSGTAHRKGSNYQAIINKMGIKNIPLNSAFEEILVDGLSFLKLLYELVQSEKIFSLQDE